MQDYTNERVKGWCVSVCVWLFSASLLRDSCPRGKGPRLGCLQLPLLFKRRTVDLVMSRSFARRCAFHAVQRIRVSADVQIYCVDQLLGWIITELNHSAGLIVSMESVD